MSYNKWDGFCASAIIHHRPRALILVDSFILIHIHTWFCVTFKSLRALCIFEHKTPSTRLHSLVRKSNTTSWQSFIDELCSSFWHWLHALVLYLRLLVRQDLDQLSTPSLIDPVAVAIYQHQEWRKGNTPHTLPRPAKPACKRMMDLQ